jgi:hypothetical protein
MSPTFVPAGWNAACMTTVEAYRTAIAAEYPELLSILPEKNVVVCGGAASWAMTGNKSRLPGDIDLFMYGLPDDESEASRKMRWNCVGRIVRKIRSQFESYKESLTVGILTIIGYRKINYTYEAKQPKYVKFQIILRAYKSVSSILHGFDVPAASIAFDGHVIVMTTIAAFAHMFRVNIIVPEYRSTTYESRLIKYFERGFALCMPNLDIARLSKSVTSILPYCKLTPTRVRGNFAAGKVELIATQPTSDYEPIKPNIDPSWRVRGMDKYGKNYINLKMITADKPLVILTYHDEHHRWRRYDSHVINYGSFWNEPTKETIIPRPTLKHAIDRIAKGIVDRIGRVNVVALKQVFKMSDDHIIQLVSAVSAATAENPGARIDVTPSLAQHIDHLLSKYDDRPSAIQWWILNDPTRQYTSSINPRVSNPADWYGTWYKDVSVPDPSCMLDTILGAYETKVDIADGKIFDGTCSICHGNVRTGDLNSVTLKCGHVVHHVQSEDCMGLIAWTSAGHRTCPVCRDQIGQPRDEDEDAHYQHRGRRVEVTTTQIDIFAQPRE